MSPVKARGGGPAAIGPTGPAGAGPSARSGSMAREHDACMFVRYFMDLDVPFADAEAALLADPSAWLPGLVEETDAEGVHRLTSVGFGIGVHVRKRVEVEVDPPLRVPSRVVVPLRWTTGAEHSPLPSMEGDLELAPFGAGTSHLAMSGRYTPPYRAVGQALDRALLNRVAEATVRDFVQRVAEQIKRTAIRNHHPASIAAAQPSVTP
jgi:hypothetical protein